MSDFNIKQCIEKLENTGDYRVLRRFEPVDAYHLEDTDENKLVGIYVDVETTGLNPGIDKIIELAIVAFEFLPDGRIFRILETFDQFQDPGFSIPEGITALTGITNNMVRGKELDKDKVNKLIELASVIIAHNAAFDRNFLEGEFPLFIKKAWACSIRDIPWVEKGIEGTKLEFIAYRFGFFFDGHRAINDCLAGVHILAQTFHNTDDSILKTLLDHARESEYRVWALDSPYDAKDILKARRYSWNPGTNHHPRAWYKDVPSNQLKQEVAFLQEEIYGQMVELQIDIITAFDRYTDRTKRYKLL